MFAIVNEFRGAVVKTIGDAVEVNAELEQLEYTSKALPDPIRVRVWTVYPAP